MLLTSGWLKITAANGLDIPYLGYLELPVEAMDVTQSPSAVPALIGMNILGQCRQLVYAEFDTTLGGELKSDWREVFQQMQSASCSEKRIAGKEAVHIPALSVSTLMVKGKKSKLTEGSVNLLLVPGNSPLPEGLIVVPSLVSIERPLFPVQVF